MKIIDRAALLAADDAKAIDVPVPEWGADAGVRMRTLTSGERATWENGMFTVTVEDGPDGKPVQKRLVNKNFNMRTTLVGLCLIDDKGARLFQNDEVDLLTSKNGTVMNRLFNACMAHNGMGEGAVEAAEKNSERNPDDSSASGSRAN